MNLMGMSRGARVAFFAALIALAGAIIGGSCTSSDSIASDDFFYDDDSGFDILDIPSG